MARGSIRERRATPRADTTRCEIRACLIGAGLRASAQLRENQFLNTDKGVWETAWLPVEYFTISYPPTWLRTTRTTLTGIEVGISMSVLEVWRRKSVDPCFQLLGSGRDVASLSGGLLAFTLHHENIS